MANTNNGNSGFQLTEQDGFTNLSIPTAKIVKTGRVRNGTLTGVVAGKYTISNTAADREKGLAPTYVDEQGTVHVIHKLSVVLETKTAEQQRQQAEAKWGRGIVASLRKRTGLTKGKTPVTDAERISLAQLQEWIDGTRTIDYRTFDGLPAETQAKVIGLRDELATGKPAKQTKVSGMAQLAALWDAGAYKLMLEGGTIDKASYDIAEASVAAYKKQLAGQAARKAAPAAPTTEVVLTEQSDI